MRTLRTLIRGLNVNYVMVLRCKIPDYLIKQLLTGDFGQFLLLLTGQVLFDQGRRRQSKTVLLNNQEFYNL